ncbi:hypothetical protein SEA_FORZA_48 [Gordonia phage Forza]|uniref:Uncharacterized protein n=1 Tax=Gordonia phage Forza TaxID=2571247 RepID=A0A650F0H7_9CAUD|nr:hypothetical protein PP303_gp048 [Gordonia phage Forza]QEM41518.1 hypothetical protein SEA_BOOPY_49 [Gordonia phage Boopy]QGT55041.1 hypothetical protein SEA_FORZA_48 [Gordonia phage Forza]UXE04191.1 hypothetical protein SEA_BLUENGOLD_47 [Gordonia phage BlueNGold]WBF03830.1 hypothetical protein SEA_MAREELIH_47 [Gordonia phage Mareelih]
MYIATPAQEKLDRVLQAVIDNGWKRAGLIYNLNDDGCVRRRWTKGSGKTESALYFGVHGETGEVVDFRGIVGNRQQSLGEPSVENAIAFIQENY